MLKLIAFVISLSAPPSDPPNDFLKSIQVFYHDTVTTKGKDVYREFTRVGEDPFSKPIVIDVVIAVSVKSNGDPLDTKMQIMIEELYEPLGLSNTLDGLKKKTWVPHKVIFSGNGNHVKNGKITARNVQYQTAYFIDSMLYRKLGFRVVAIYYDRETGKFESIEKEFMIGD